MRVLYLTGNANRASSNRPTEAWFRLLRPRGLRPVLVSDRVGAFHLWALQEGIPAFHVPLPFPNKFAPWSLLRSLWTLLGIVKRSDIQLIHCIEHEIYPIGQYLARLTGLPLLVGVHCRLERGFSKWAFGGARQPQRMFFVSRGSLEACRPGVRGVVPESAWRLLYNGLDLDHFKPDQSLRSEFRRRHGLEAEFVVGTACALRPGKQLEHLFGATSRLSIRGVRVVVAGGAVPGDEQYAVDLLEDAGKTLNGQFLYLGHLDELRGLYNGLDLFVNTSKEEACSISIMEALACGCPVVGYPSTSVAEQILPGGGEIVGQDEPGALAKAVDEWLRDPERLAEGRLTARRRAEETFDIRKIADQLWREYEDVLRQ